MRIVEASDVAAQLRVSKVRIYQLAREGLLPGVVRLGCLVRFDLDQIEPWIQAGGSSLPGGWRREPLERHADVR